MYICFMYMYMYMCMCTPHHTHSHAFCDIIMFREVDISCVFVLCYTGQTELTPSVFVDPSIASGNSSKYMFMGCVHYIHSVSHLL